MLEDIQAKARMAQSVISGYLLTMQKAGLLESERVGQGRIIYETKRPFVYF